MPDIEEILRKPCWIIDILPQRVPEDSPGQYFAVERYFLRHRAEELREKQLSLLLKLNCYLALTVYGEVNPAPELLAEALGSRELCVLAGDALFFADPGDTYLTLYNPDEALLALVRRIAESEGLFVWKGVD